ncbi:sensor histidine kinase [Bacillus shivajii]|uniref:sensor histidine kinase n=1 Tax=Bacillus shivajii TaxID=1983719 RepID=UPI001CFB07C6|nr:sensor histidine kinase [Bacillus shivajii]UCZ52114.1 sensor histidine kinase [Bacillus shivajii]
MNVILKQMMYGILSFTVFAILILVPSFIMFPLDNWSLLIEQRLFDLPYVFFMVIMIMLSGAASGVITGTYFRRKLKWVSDQLEVVKSGEQLRKEEKELKDIEEIYDQFFLLQSKLNEQTKNVQKLASERAYEREKSLQEVVVQERNRLARELHDSVSQQLFAASMMMSTINEMNPPEDEGLRKQLELVGKMIEQSQLEMRALLLHLRPAALKGKSLYEGIKELLLELKEKVPIQINEKIEDLSLAKGVEDHLFRVLQESLSNTLRHAKANHLEVLLIERDNYIILRITDDGIGFNVEETTGSSSYGLDNMKERAEEIGGTLKIVSLKNEGTRLEVKVPVLQRGDEE